MKSNATANSALVRAHIEQATQDLEFHFYDRAFEKLSAGATECLFGVKNFEVRRDLIWTLHKLNVSWQAETNADPESMEAYWGVDFDIRIQASIARSGSTVVWQVLDALLPSRVFKVHFFPRVCIPVYMTMRDLRDVVLSRFVLFLRRQELPIDADLDEKAPQKFEEIVNHVISQSRNMHTALVIYQRLGVGNVLYYENFRHNTNEIINNISMFENVSVDNQMWLEISKNFSLQSNQKRARLFNTFSEYSQTTYIHGDHIFDGTPGMWRHWFSDRGCHFLDKSLKEELHRWGYST